MVLWSDGVHNSFEMIFSQWNSNASFAFRIPDSFIITTEHATIFSSRNGRGVSLFEIGLSRSIISQPSNPPPPPIWNHRQLQGVKVQLSVLNG
jgi:hypothetical protein